MRNYLIYTNIFCHSNGLNSLFWYEMIQLYRSDPIFDIIEFCELSTIQPHSLLPNTEGILTFDSFNYYYYYYYYYYYCCCCCNNIDPKGPKQRKCPKQLQTHNLPTESVENINSTNKGRDFLLANKAQNVPWGIEKMQQKIQKNSRVTLHDQHILNKSKTRRKNQAMAWIYYKKVYDMVLQSWLTNCLSQNVQNIRWSHKLYWENHENLKVELTARGRSLAEAKIQRGIFQGDALSPLLFIIAMMPLNHILRKCTAGYKLSRSQEKINHLMYMDDIKLFAKNEKELETLIHTVRIYSQGIGIEFSIEKCAMLVMKSGKQHLTD